VLTDNPALGTLVLLKDRAGNKVVLVLELVGSIKGFEFSVFLAEGTIDLAVRLVCDESVRHGEAHLLWMSLELAHWMGGWMDAGLGGARARMGGRQRPMKSRRRRTESSDLDSAHLAAYLSADCAINASSFRVEEPASGATGCLDGWRQRNQRRGGAGPVRAPLAATGRLKAPRAVKRAQTSRPNPEQTTRNYGEIFCRREKGLIWRSKV